MKCNGKGQFGFGGTIGFEKIIGWNVENANVSVWEDDYFPMNRKIAAEFIYKLKWAQFETGLSYFNEHYQTANYKGPRNHNIPTDFESDNIGIPLKIKFRLNIPEKENFIYFLTETEFVFSLKAKKIIYGSPSVDTKILESNNLDYQRLDLRIGIGYCAKIHGPLFWSLDVDISTNINRQSILDHYVGFNKYGVNTGLSLFF
jgi:hypothetical protein